MSADNRVARIARLKATLSCVGWKEAKRIEHSGTIMCGWIANEFVYICLKDFVECCQTDSFDKDSDYIVRRIWKIHCHKNPEICEHESPDQELINREFDCERMDSSEKGRKIKTVKWRSEPFKVADLKMKDHLDKHLEILKDGLSGVGITSNPSAAVRPKEPYMGRRSESEVRARQMMQTLDMQQQQLNPMREMQRRALQKIIEGEEYTEDYKEEEEDEGAKIAKKNIVRKSIESISRAFEDKFGLKTKS